MVLFSVRYSPVLSRGNSGSSRTGPADGRQPVRALRAEKGCGILFEKGEYIVYGMTGVCRVCDITEMDTDGNSGDRLYYVLEPAGTHGGRIITPVEGNKNVMRRILTREEAYDLIDGIREIDSLWITDDRQRENRYKEALKTCDCREWVGIIKTLYIRKKERLNRGKRMTEVDERYMKKTKENLYGELSIPLGIPAAEVERFITSRIDGADADTETQQIRTRIGTDANIRNV